MGLGMLLLIVAFVLALLAAIGAPSSRVNLFALAFAIYVLSALVGGVHLTS